MRFNPNKKMMNRLGMLSACTNHKIYLVYGLSFSFRDSYTDKHNNYINTPYKFTRNHQLFQSLMHFKDMLS